MAEPITRPVTPGITKFSNEKIAGSISWPAAVLPLEFCLFQQERAFANMQERLKPDIAKLFMLDR